MEPQAIELVKTGASPALPLFLPNEIWLNILEFVECERAWLSIRPTNRQLYECVESHVRTKLVPYLVLNLSYFSRYGILHRWFRFHDVAEFEYKGFDNDDQSRCRLAQTFVRPEGAPSAPPDGMEKCRRLCSGEIAPELVIQVQQNKESPIRALTLPWYELRQGVSPTRRIDQLDLVKRLRLAEATTDEVSMDWRTMISFWIQLRCAREL